MKIENENYNESNYSIYTRGTNLKTTSGNFPLLKFNQNLYNSCQSKLSKFINHRKNDIRLIINKKINQQISFDDYITNTTNNQNTNELTPIPFISKRKIKNNIEKKELKNYQRNVVLMRRLEYTNKMKEKKLKQRYNKKIKKIIYIQKVIRGYLVRKIIRQVNIINETLSNFFFLIKICILKKYYKILIKNIMYMIKKIDNIVKNNEYIKNIGNEDINLNINNYDEITLKNDFNINNVIKKNDNSCEQLNNDTERNKNNLITDMILENIEVINKKLNEEQMNKNININSNNKTHSTNKKINTKIPKNKYNTSPFQKEEKQQDSVIENDEYIDFSSKDPNQIDSKKDPIIKNKEFHNRNPKNDKSYYLLSDISSYLEIKKAKTEIIQRQFRKYLSKKGYYGTFDRRKIVIIYLLKNMVIYIIRPYVLNIIKLYYKLIKNITVTQEENFVNLSSERIKNVNRVYNRAKNEII